MSLRTIAGIVLLALTFAGCAQPATGGAAPAGSGVPAAPAPAVSNGVGGDGAAFCAAFAASQERLNPNDRGLDALEELDPAAVGDEWDRIAAIAPAEIAPDLRTLAEFWHAMARGEPNPEGGEELLNALDRFKEVYPRLCG